LAARRARAPAGSTGKKELSRTKNGAGRFAPRPAYVCLAGTVCPKVVSQALGSSAVQAGQRLALSGIALMQYGHSLVVTSAATGFWVFW
jgi:hypothetical protein